MVRLREGTAGSHGRLEASLALLDPPIVKDRFITLLERFYGFHAVWEPSITRHFEIAFLTPRRRTRLLESDLTALGRSAARSRPPLCLAAADLGHDADKALGSLYVMEGSTLGGQVIARGLHGTGWGEGIRYFNPYGTGTGRMWSGLKALVLQRSGPAADAKIIAGAVSTFDLLQNWLRPAFPERA